MQTVRNTLPRRFGAPGLPELNASQVWLSDLTFVGQSKQVTNHNILDSISTVMCKIKKWGFLQSEVQNWSISTRKFWNWSRGKVLWTGLCCEECAAKACKLDSGTTGHWKNSDVSSYCLSLSETGPGPGDFLIVCIWLLSFQRMSTCELMPGSMEVRYAFFDE